MTAVITSNPNFIKFAQVLEIPTRSLDTKVKDVSKDIFLEKLKLFESGEKELIALIGKKEEKLQLRLNQLEDWFAGMLDELKSAKSLELLREKHTEISRLGLEIGARLDSLKSNQKNQSEQLVDFEEEIQRLRILQEKLQILTLVVKEEEKIQDTIAESSIELCNKIEEQQALLQTIFSKTDNLESASKEIKQEISQIQKELIQAQRELVIAAKEIEEAQEQRQKNLNTLGIIIFSIAAACAIATIGTSLTASQGAFTGIAAGDSAGIGFTYTFGEGLSANLVLASVGGTAATIGLISASGDKTKESPRPAAAKEKKDDDVITFPKKDELKKCLTAHPLFQDEYLQEKGIGQKIINLAADRFGESYKKVPEGVQLGTMFVLDDVIHEEPNKGNRALLSRIMPELLMNTEKALTDCAKKGPDRGEKSNAAPLKKTDAIEFPAKNELERCLINHEVFKSNDYLNEKGISQKIASLAAEQFGGQEKAQIGVELGSHLLLHNLINHPRERLPDQEDRELLSKTAPEVRIFTEKALMDCAKKDLIEEKN